MTFKEYFEQGATQCKQIKGCFYTKDDDGNNYACFLGTFHFSMHNNQGGDMFLNFLATKFPWLGSRIAKEEWNKISFFCNKHFRISLPVNLNTISLKVEPTPINFIFILNDEYSLERNQIMAILEHLWPEDVNRDIDITVADLALIENLITATPATKKEEVIENGVCESLK